MKKTLVALAVASTAVFAASSASAVTVYNQDGTKVDVGGSVRMFLGRAEDGQRGDLINDGSRIEIKASQDLGNSLSAFGGYQLRFDSKKSDTSTSTWGNPTTKRLFLGLKQDSVGALSFGRQATSSDDFLNDQAYFTSASGSPLTKESEKSIKFRSAEWNGFSLGLDYLFGDADKSTGTSYGYKSGYQSVLFYNKAIDDVQSVEAGLLYSRDRYEGVGSETGFTNTQWGAHAGYMYGPFDIRASYVKFDYDYAGSLEAANYDGGVQGNYVLVDVGYRVIPESRVYGQWERVDFKYNDSSETNGRANVYTAGIDYKLHKNVLTFAEYSHKTVKNIDNDKASDNVFGVGLRVFF